MSAAIDPDHWVASRHALITQQRKAEVANHVTEAAFQKLAGSRSWLLKEQVSPLLQSVTGAKATIGDAEVNLVVDYVIENRPIDDYARQDVADSAAEMRLASKQLIDATEKFRYFLENKALATKAYTKFAGPGGALTRKQFADAMAFIAQDCKKTDSQGRLKDFVVKEEEVKLIAAGCETSADGSIPQSEALPALELFHRIVDTQMKDDSCVVM